MTILVSKRTSGTELIYTVPAEQRATLRVLFSNAAATQTTVKVWAVPAGGSADDNALIISALVLLANDWDASAELILDAGDSIYVLSGNNTVTFHVNGLAEFIKMRGG